MSVSATLTIDCSNYSDKIFDIILLFNKKIGWMFMDDKMHYTLFDNDDVDFHYEVITMKNLKKSLLSDKVKENLQL